MPLLTGSQLAKAYGPDDIFAGVTVSIPHGVRIALMGPNGVGKTSLLRLFAGVAP
jgi:ATPase subunit of ABC transporter with duplicated ATPase domains